VGDLDSELGQLEAALQSDPSSVTQMQLDGVMSLVDEDTPVDTRLRMLKAVLAFQVQIGAWRDAVQASQQIVMIYRSIKEESLLLPALTYQGKLMARAGMVNEAETAFTEVLFKLKAAGGQPLLAHLLVMADFALFHGSPQRAFQFLRDASALEPGSDRLKLDMANCLDMLRRHDEASKARQISGQLAFQARWEQAKSFERRSLWNDCLGLIESTLPLLGPGLTPDELLDWKAKWIGLKGQVLQPLGRLVEAETAQIEIYQELMQVRGIQSLDTATSAANLARLWQHQKALCKKLSKALSTPTASTISSLVRPTNSPKGCATGLLSAASSARTTARPSFW
jgi:tetratricopeptide (TPR) repeat protein